MGRGAEIELARGRTMIERKMIKEGVTEYVFDSITPGEYTFRHTFGPVLWKGELTKAELIGSGESPTVTNTLTDLGKGNETLGKMEMKVVSGKEFGNIVIMLNYNKKNSIYLSDDQNPLVRRTRGFHFVCKTFDFIFPPANGDDPELLRKERTLSTKN
eukprot:TRINITY_DN29114_c0_g1_i1.p1 TRINITY_DN29114_c0_g1~~TRINITY_DN29114_c0_g1_i1.p1  ORF type:complete len:158 (+),score=3.81 TRINITY_DN29114_c0_g1_i1:210-683(+)